jgi:hypothetical protein
LNDEAQREFREVQAYFRLPSVGLVEKDVHVVRAIRASRNGLRRELGRLGDRVTQVLQDAGFAFDPADKASVRSQNENRYTVWQLPYAGTGGAGQGLCGPPSRSS